MKGGDNGAVGEWVKGKVGAAAGAVKQGYKYTKKRFGNARSCAEDLIENYDKYHSSSGQVKLWQEEGLPDKQEWGANDDMETKIDKFVTFMKKDDKKDICNIHTKIKKENKELKLKLEQSKIIIDL